MTVAKDCRVDEMLVRRAQLRATGATIHKVAGLLQAYRSACELASKEPDEPEWAIMAEAKERAVRAFVATGRITEGV